MPYDQSQQAYAQSVGTSSTNYAHIDTRNPNSNDVFYPIGKFWVNTTNQTLWYLNNQTTITGVLQSNWVAIQSSVETLVGDDGLIIVPNLSNAIDIFGATVAHATNPKPVFTKKGATSELDIDVQVSSAAASSNINNAGLSSFNSAKFSVDANGFVDILGSEAISKIAVNTSSPPGTNPVVPDGAGQITVIGGQVAAGTTSNVIQTDSLAANTYTIQVQRSQAAALSTIGDNGVCHFNNTQFTVDANGFVELLGGGAAIEKVNVQTGTSPVVPSSGAITINGASVVAGTNPVRSDGTGANTLAIEVQTSQAIAFSDATKIGLSNFDSASFTVDANGFVQVAGGSVVKKVGVDASTAPGTNPVLPNVSGQITVTGGQVAAGTTANVIQTNSLAADTYTIQVQRSQAVASSTIGDNGVCHFNNTQFSVDANGFVSMSGGGVYISLSPYIVGPDIHSGFSTIQAAINQAVIDGASATNEKNIYIKPGTYTENLTLSDGINIMGMDSNIGSDNGVAATFPSNGFPSVKLVGKITHSSGDSKVYNLFIVPPINTNVFELTATGGFFEVKGCNIQTSGTCTIFNFTASEDVYVDSTTQSLSSSGTQLFSIANTINGVILFARSSFIGNTTSTMGTSSRGEVDLGNSNILSTIDATNALSFTFSSTNSRHTATGGSTFLIKTGATTTGSTSYYNSNITPAAVNPFSIANSAYNVYLVNSFIAGFDGNVTGGGSSIKSNAVGPNYEEIQKSIVLYNGSDWVKQQASAHTTDATVTTLASVVVNQLESITFSGTVTAAQSDHTNAVGGNFLITARRASGGNITIVGVAIVNVNSSSTATFTCDVDTGTQTVRLRITGVAATVYNWVCTYEYQKVLTNA